MTSYWYSTNGLDQRRLSNRHSSKLDQAFERHACVQLFDDELFGQNVAAIANPYQGTMTAGDIHFGLYRQPPMWRMSNTSLDTLILMDMTTMNLDDEKANVSNESSRSNNSSSNNSNNNNNNNNNNSSKPRYNRLSQQAAAIEDHCVCCRIS